MSRYTQPSARFGFRIGAPKRTRSIGSALRAGYRTAWVGSGRRDEGLEQGRGLPPLSREQNYASATMMCSGPIIILHLDGMFNLDKDSLQCSDRTLLSVAVCQTTNGHVVADYVMRDQCIAPRLSGMT